MSHSNAFVNREPSQYELNQSNVFSLTCPPSVEPATKKPTNTSTDTRPILTPRKQLLINGHTELYRAPGLEVIQSATRMPQLSAERYYAGFCSAKKARPETVERGTQTMARVQDTKKRPKQSKMD